MMKPDSILINLARGPVVDSQALYTALNNKWIRAAALDVIDPEPIPPDDPLLTLENLVITPHIGSASVASRRETCMVAARNLVAGIDGQRLEYCANPELYPSKGPMRFLLFVKPQSPNHPQAALLQLGASFLRFQQFSALGQGNLSIELVSVKSAAHIQTFVFGRGNPKVNIQWKHR